MSKSLYNITQDQKEMIRFIEMLDGEITPDTEERLVINQTELEVKSIAYLEFIKKSEGFVSQIDQEVKRLTGLKKRNENMIGRLKGNLLDAVTTFGDFDTKFNKFGTRKSQSVEIENIKAIPKEFIVTTETHKPDKTALKIALKRGEIIEGAKLMNNVNLKIN